MRLRRRCCSREGRWCLPIALACLQLAVGCGVQLAPGLRSDGSGSEAWTLEGSAHLHRARGSGPAASLGIVAAQPADRFGLRHIALGAGYRLVPADALRLELGSELAVGEPATASYDGTALYLGGAVTLLTRLPVFGRQHDNMVGVAPFGYALDLVVSGRGGRWSRGMANRGPGRWELGVELGLRVTLFSDLFLARQRGWEGPWTEH